MRVIPDPNTLAASESRSRKTDMGAMIEISGEVDNFAG
jgi:hypothetical protein